MQRGYVRDALHRGRSDRNGRLSGEVGDHSGISVAIFGLTYPSNTRNRVITICHSGVTK